MINLTHHFLSRLNTEPSLFFAFVCQISLIFCGLHKRDNRDCVRESVRDEKVRNTSVGVGISLFSGVWPRLITRDVRGTS
jgi:hypothetical protein